MPADDPTRKIPARYMGDGRVKLRPHDRHLSGDGTTPHSAIVDPDSGKPRGLLLYPGDTLMLPTTEVLGQTYLMDPTGDKPALWLGAGLVLLKDHRATAPRDLIGARFLGPDGVIREYEFHEGRADFEPLDANDAVRRISADTFAPNAPTDALGAPTATEGAFETATAVEAPIVEAIIPAKPKKQGQSADPFPAPSDTSPSTSAAGADDSAQPAKD